MTASEAETNRPANCAIIPDMADADRPYRVLSILEEDTIPIEGGKIQWIPLRRRLGIGAFGTNAYRAARAGDAIIEEHVESPGQEELYVVIAGRAKLVVDGEEVEAPAGAAVFVPDPQVRRSGVALEDNTAILAVGGWRDKPYNSLPWEPIFLAQEPMRRGDWAAAADTLEREAGEHIDNAFVQYRLACCHAEAGNHERALDAVRRSLAANPKMRERVEAEKHLASLRELDGWADAIR
jgi:mannose-6-phosphate isomerase-like protein (cupin superfamily)